MRRGLGRDGFREGVFARDRRRCVVCSAPAVDAHHLLERRLFADGGYELDNGVSLCGPHHMDAESTAIGCEALRRAAGIDRVVLPPHLHPGRGYDKWGNPIRGDGRRLRGELYFEEPVQRVLAPRLRDFVPRVEAQRIAHLPWSPGAAELVVADVDALLAEAVVVLEAPPGEIVTIDGLGIYVGADEAVAGAPAEVEALSALVAELAPPGGRIFGVLEGATLRVLDAWDGRDHALEWEEVELLAELLEAPIVAVRSRGRIDR
ncbi:MAG: HNH endonuclease, partial [Nannocystaceae bacterium]